MPTHPRSSPEPHHPSKRQRASSPDKDSPASATTGEPSPATETSEAGHSSKVGQSSNFRNVSACNRCRLRKNRCDQKLPSCASCEKAGVACVGYDPITKREIPRRCANPHFPLHPFPLLIPRLAMFSILSPASSSSRLCFAPTTYSSHPPKI